MTCPWLKSFVLAIRNQSAMLAASANVVFAKPVSRLPRFAAHELPSTARSSMSNLA